MVNVFTIIVIMSTGYFSKEETFFGFALFFSEDHLNCSSSVVF